MTTPSLAAAPYECRTPDAVGAKKMKNNNKKEHEIIGTASPPLESSTSYVSISGVSRPFFFRRTTTTTKTASKKKEKEKEKKNATPSYAKF